MNGVTIMKINKEFILKNLITICCAASIILLFLPFANVSVSLESSFINASGSTTITGFDTIGGESSSLFSWLMLIYPIVLVAMNYIKQLDKYKSILAIILPIVSVISAVCTLLFSAKGGASAGGETASASAKMTPNIGFFLLIVTYIGTLIAGAMTFYGLKLSKEGIAEFGNKLKEEGLSGLESMKEYGQKVSSGTVETSVTSDESADKKDDFQSVKSSRPTVSSIQQKQVKKTNVSQANEVLELINQLSAMKEQGVLTEEEFNEKKKDLLSQI